MNGASKNKGEEKTMAEIYKLGGSIDMYNVSYGVGDGMFNKMDDVMLVQWLIRNHFSRMDKRSRLGSRYHLDIINGVWGKSLGELIKIYQYDANMTVTNCDLDLDGKIYPIQGCGGPNKSALVWLNLSMSGHAKSYYHNPKSDPAVYYDVKQMFDRCGTVN